MLLDFALENFGPFRDRVTLSLHATGHREHPENVIPCDAVKGGVLSFASLFGPNASGKSYVFKAIRALKRMVWDAYPEGTRFPWYDPFVLNDVNPGMPVSLEIRFVDGGVLYHYSVSFGEDRVSSESLVYYPHGRPKTAFRRGGDRESYSGKQRKIREFLTPSSAFLVIGAKYNDEICAKVRGMILGIIDLESDDMDEMAQMSCDWALSDPSKKSMLIDGLKKADLAIVDFERTENLVDKESMRPVMPPAMYDSIPTDEKGKIRFGSVRLMHSYGSPSLKGRKFAFELNRESTGTKSMFGIMGPLADALMNGKTMIVDEFGAHLHPMLTRWLVSQFSSDNNPNGAQLVVITHDVSLMDTDGLLRRDQVYFTDKDRDDGSSSLYCLSDFRGVRKDEIVLKSYIAGRFDAIPDVSIRGLMDGRENRCLSQEGDPQQNAHRVHSGRWDL